MILRAQAPEDQPELLQRIADVLERAASALAPLPSPYPGAAEELLAVGVQHRAGVKELRLPPALGEQYRLKVEL